VLARDEPTAWIYHARGVQGLTRRITDVRMDLRGELASVADWRLANGPPDGGRE
jgi:peptide/nickel transport system substrate-binding protein